MWKIAQKKSRESNMGSRVEGGILRTESGHTPRRKCFKHEEIISLKLTISSTPNIPLSPLLE